MLDIALFCTNCGKRFHRSINEDFPPSYIRCDCGTRYELAVSTEEEIGRTIPGGGGGEEGFWSGDVHVSESEFTNMF